MQNRNILLCGGAALALAVTGVALTSGGSADAQGPAGCYGGALKCDEDKLKVQAKAAATTRAALPDNGFAGEWTGRGDGASTFAAIKATSSANRYAIELVATNNGGCGGGMEGVGTARGNVLVLRA